MSFTYRENYVALWNVFKIYYPYHPKVIQERMLTNASQSCCLRRGYTSARNYAQVHPATRASPLTPSEFALCDSKEKRLLEQWFSNWVVANPVGSHIRYYI